VWFGRVETGKLFGFAFCPEEGKAEIHEGDRDEDGEHASINHVVLRRRPQGDRSNAYIGT
jgi:hypothetical protein